ncbi:MAG: UpxY family transcription antiterminator [Flavobacteriales bacterium]
MNKEEARWMVFYTHSRHEKKADAALIEAGYTSYLPLVETIKQWSDRKKKVKEPLFRSYIFVKTSIMQVSKVSETFGIVGPVRLGDEYAIVTEKEIETIKATANSGYAVELSDYSFEEGEDVQLVGGPLKGIKGRFSTKASASYICILIEGLNQGIKVKVPTHLVKPLKKSPAA